MIPSKLETIKFLLSIVKTIELIFNPFICAITFPFTDFLILIILSELAIAKKLPVKSIDIFKLSTNYAPSLVSNYFKITNCFKQKIDIFLS